MNSTGKKVLVTETFVPPFEQYMALIEQVFASKHLTNNGPLVQKLETELKKTIQSDNVLFVSNGTIAIQLAIKALELKGEIITTPYSYCATTTAIMWENATPVFVDVCEEDFNINPDLIEAAITPQTSGILATHVYGLPCNVDAIAAIAKKHNIPVIYDAAHAFGVQLNGKPLLTYGDVATCSFHATKVFHTVEGGCVVTSDADLLNTISLYRSFGHIGDDYQTMGINGKNSEFHAAMGLCNLPLVPEIIADRKLVFEQYDALLNWDKLRKPVSKLPNLTYNYAYYPVIFESYDVSERVFKALEAEAIFARRYFFPSLNKLKYVPIKDFSCPVSESAAGRVLSLPLSTYIKPETIAEIAAIVNANL